MEEMVNVKIKDGEYETWVFTKKINAFLGNTLYYMGEKWIIIELDKD